MKHRNTIKALILRVMTAAIISISSSGTGLAFPNRDFRLFQLEGSPVRPSCVAIFNLGITDKPLVDSVDLSECQKSNITRKNGGTNTEGQLYFYRNDKNALGGMYAYQVYGVTRSGIYVLHTFEFKPDGVVTDALLFLELSPKKSRFFTRNGLPRTKPATLAVLRGYVMGGDRCSGGIKTVRIVGDSIVIQQYPYINAVGQCGGEKEYTIETGIKKNNHIR